MLLNEHLFVSECLGGTVCVGPQRDTMRDMETKRFNFPDPVPNKRFNFPHTVPLVQLETGGIRVRNSRVTLETIVHRMQMGDTAQEINDSFPTVSVTIIKEILAWYFENKAEADEYLQQVEEEGEKVRQWAESQPEYKEWHEKLLRRKAELSRT